MWKSLTDDEVREIRDRYIDYSWTEGFWRFVNDMDNKLKEKNECIHVTAVSVKQ